MADSNWRDWRISNIKTVMPAVRPAWLRAIEKWHDEEVDKWFWRQDVLPIIAYGVASREQDQWNTSPAFFVAVDGDGPQWAILSNTKQERTFHTFDPPESWILPPFCDGCELYSEPVDDIPPGLFWVIRS